LHKIAESDLADQVSACMATYWKDTAHVVQPPERLAPRIMIHADRCEHVYIREYTGGRHLCLTPEHGVVHHLSYAGPDERIKKKITTWGHKDEVVSGWWENVWLRWD